MKPLKESFIKAKDLDKIRSKCYVYFPFGEMKKSDLDNFVKKYNLKEVHTKNSFYSIIIDNNEALKYIIDKLSNQKQIKFYEYIGNNNVKEVLEKLRLEYDIYNRSYIDDDNFIKINNINEI